jgi:hypothetical protein
MVGLRQQRADHGRTVKELEAGLAKAKKKREAMREKLDEWNRALSRAEEMAAARFRRAVDEGG